ncbi:Splicing factor U2AF, large subunit (RRM superfamily) [Handroanthus impetiginosus]|uniref:Splicing factor U2AF, large subunit (RRM superfamily) n=1 Tax=Handroanthus impetiginosus TaxID=429701 RepID=A0A2G9HY92_9LAMI|nr:Splicing factor U2AF, large subunit (RRM superfamily) [Handroanthus impetiginosus]
MTKSRPEEKSGISNEVSQDDLLEGTSARTRPLSFNDIMLARKERGDTTKQAASGPGVAEIALAREETAVHSSDYHGQINEESGPMDIGHTSNDSQKVRSRRKEDTNASRKNKKLAQDKAKGPRGLDTNLKSIGDKNISSNRVTEEKSEKHHHSNRKRDSFVDDSDNKSDKRQARDSIKKERVSERRGGKSEIDRKQLHNEDRQVSRKRKTDGPLTSDFENEYKNRNARDLVQTDKLTERGRDKSEKENRHRHHNEEDKSRGRSTDKKHDSGRKGLESTRGYLEESRSKRRRSRSRERNKERARRSLSHSPKAHKHATKDKREHGELLSQSTKDRSGREEQGRRSLSHSPKAHKHTSKDKREHQELLLHSAKDRSGREHSDIETKRISINGSSSHYRRNTGSSSGLGGYSPRKRKSDAAAKTPSPTRRSPERRTAGWDLQPAEKESTTTGSTLPSVLTTYQSLPLNVKEFPSGTTLAPSVANPIGISHQTLSSHMHAIESIQLTQATRPMRRLYVENLPASASEKDLIECINKFLLSSGVNYIRGTEPCISCIIHKEKGQALLEFLTPEDASVALSFDGIPFAGSNLKFRRPKDYANVTTDLPEKSTVAGDSVSGDVVDSPHKIFIGGFPKLITSKMLLEIARAFGPVKAFHFEFNADMDEPCAFLEYADHSVTSKACAGLNGMKLGGKVVTAVFATPDAVLENVGKLPFYGIPEHAKPLLEKPTSVLKLKNVLDPEGFSSFCESEVDEILEDIRLECSRFGTVKSINVAKPTNSTGAIEAFEVKSRNASTDGCDFETDDRSHITEQLGMNINELMERDRLELSETQNELETNNQSVQGNNGCDDSAGISEQPSDDSAGILEQPSGSVESEDINRSKAVGEIFSGEMTTDNLMKDEMCKPPSNDGSISAKEDPSTEEHLHSFTGDSVDPQNSSVDEFQDNDSIQMKNKPLIDEDLKLEENNAKNASSVEMDTDGRKELDAPDGGNKKDISSNLSDDFEPGSIFVEYRRPEAACMAAHCLHGRIFDGRVVTVEYVGHDLYQIRFRR